MADPRKAVVWSAVGDYITVKADGSTITYSATAAYGCADVGKAVTLSTDDTAALAGDGEAVLGRLEKVGPDGYCTVKWRGDVKLPAGTSATIDLGSRIVGDLLVSAKGYIQSAASGTAAHHVVSRGLIVNNNDTDNVVVLL